MEIDMLAGLLDDKLIKIMSLFVKHPEKKFYLSEVSRLSGINNATTFRILNKLVKENFVKAVIIGKVRIYQLLTGERANSLVQLLKKGGVGTTKKGGLEIFCEKVGTVPRVEKILLDSKTPNSAKVIIIGNHFSTPRIERICREISEAHNFKISFVEFTSQQFESMKGFDTFSLNKKVLFSKE